MNEEEIKVKLILPFSKITKSDSVIAVGKGASLGEMLNAGIPVPDGLLMMAKSLLTIEGLARGIDPEVSFARAAGPVLLRAGCPRPFRRPSP